MVEFANYGQHREIDATPEEMEIYGTLKELCPDLELCRKSDGYVTAMLGEWDLARFKFTQRAKWINFPTVEKSSVKNRIQHPEDTRGFADKVAESVARIRKYSE